MDEASQAKVMQANSQIEFTEPQSMNFNKHLNAVFKEYFEKNHKNPLVSQQ